MSALAGRRVLIAGATSESGHAVTRALLAGGAEVLAVGRDALRLAPLDALGARTEVCELTDEAAVLDLRDRVHAAGGPIDGLIPLVGGWRGGGGLAGQTDADYRMLESSFTAVRHTSRAFDADLRASSGGRFAVVSSTAVARPLAGGANYAAVKAATEAWTRAVAQGFAKAARDGGTELSAASVVFRVKGLGGLEGMLAARIAGLWDAPAADLNDTILTLSADPQP